MLDCWPWTWSSNCGAVEPWLAIQTSFRIVGLRPGSMSSKVLPGPLSKFHWPRYNHKSPLLRWPCSNSVMCVLRFYTVKSSLAFPMHKVISQCPLKTRWKKKVLLIQKSRSFNLSKQQSDFYIFKYFKHHI